MKKREELPEALVIQGGRAWRPLGRAEQQLAEVLRTMGANAMAHETDGDPCWTVITTASAGQIAEAFERVMSGYTWRTWAANEDQRRLLAEGKTLHTKGG